MFLLPCFFISSINFGSSFANLLMKGWSFSFLISNTGKGPLSFAISTEERYASRAIVLCTSTEKSMAFSLPYLNPSAASISPSAVIPTPVLLPSTALRLIFSHKLISTCLISLSSGSETILSIIASTFSSSRSMISSMIRWANPICFLNFSQLNLALSVNGPST